jgi:hypothetical protein
MDVDHEMCFKQRIATYASVKTKLGVSDNVKAMLSVRESSITARIIVTIPQGKNFPCSS